MSQLEKTIKNWKRVSFFTAFLEFCARMIGAGAVFLSLALGLDRLLALSSLMRRTLWVFSVLFLVWVFWRWALKPFLEFKTLRLLDEAEKKFPFLRLHLKSAWELSIRKTEDFSSSDLKHAHIEEAERLLSSSQKISLRPGFTFSTTLRLGAAAVLILIVVFGHSQRGFLTRVVWPWKNDALEKMVKIIPGNATVDWGNSVNIQAVWNPTSIVAARFADVGLWIKTPSGWRKSPWDLIGPKGAQFNSGPVSSSFDYRLTWKDLSSERYHIAPVILPRLDSLMERLDGVDSDWSLLSAGEPMSVLSGHVLSIRGSPNQKMRQIRMKVSSLAREIEMRKISGGDYQASFFINQDTILSFDLESEDGRKNKDFDRYLIKTIPDHPPTVQVLYPLSAVEGGRRDVLPISYLAQDDGGLVRIALILTLPNGNSQEIEIERPENLHELYGDYSLDFSLLPIGISYFQMKASDNASPSQSGFSRKIMIRIVDFEARHQKTKKAWEKSEKSLRELESKDEAALPLLSPETAKKFTETEKNLSAAQKKSMEDLAALKKTLERDPYLSPALSRAISSLSEHLTQKDRRALKNAMTNASENHWKKARKEIENLLRSDQEAEKMLADARKTQSFADAASDTEKMADQAQSLSSKLSELSQKTGKSPSKADLSALSQSLSALKKAMQKLQESIKNLPAAGSMPKGSSAQNLSLDAAQQSLNDLQKALSSGDYHNAAKIAEELARQTQEIESAISKMAQQSAFSQSLMRSAQKLMEGRQALERAIEGENAVYEKTANLEKNRLQKKIEAQKEMLKELARMQGVLLSSASDQGNAFPPGILGWMKDIKNDFDSGHAGGADRLLSLVSASLRGINSWRPKPSYDYFARGEDQIRKLLKTGVRSPSADQKESLSAGQYQASVRSETELAQNELKKLELTVPDFPGDAVSDLGKAQDEQRNAESSLNGADSESALSEEAGALSRLNHGLHSLDQTLKAQSSLASGLMPGAGAQGSTLQILSGDSSGSMGANIGLVPLPSPQNYQPLKKLRKELEKSLQEKSPQRYENLIKSYFRRIAQ